MRHGRSFTSLPASAWKGHQAYTSSPAGVLTLCNCTIRRNLLPQWWIQGKRKGQPNRGKKLSRGLQLSWAVTVWNECQCDAKKNIQNDINPPYINMVWQLPQTIKVSSDVLTNSRREPGVSQSMVCLHWNNHPLPSASRRQTLWQSINIFLPLSPILHVWPTNRQKLNPCYGCWLPGKSTFGKALYRYIHRSWLWINILLGFIHGKRPDPVLKRYAHAAATQNPCVNTPGFGVP